jgi:DNA sulfur modification protein DndC
MTTTRAATGTSAFTEVGFKGTMQALLGEIRWLYRADCIPWVIGYSGGKDSTAVLQLVWLAMRDLPAGERHKPIHVISTDTLVENPIVASWVTHSLEKIRSSAAEEGLPIEAHRLTPDVGDTFWVNLIGKGYPAPRPKFRWCTERMKIRPSNTFIRNMVRANGEAIVVLGTRKAESAGRSGRMTRLEGVQPRDLLSPNLSLPNSLVFTPISSWSNDDVWMFLMQIGNPWGYDNRDLLTMYSGASADGECPLVIDTSTPSCGDSRFGCWTCTLVDRDRSMAAMIQNDEEKEWMLPLLEIRDELDIPDDRHLRDFRRMTGRVQLFHDRAIPGPYTQDVREHWLRRLLQAQAWIRRNGPAAVRDIQLITLGELHEIRRLWVYEKHEIEDSLPVIYAETVGGPFPGEPLDEHLPLGAEEMRILRQICGQDRLRFELTRELLDTERRFRGMARRAGLFEALDDAFERHFYEDEADATSRMQALQEARQAAQEAAYIPADYIIRRPEQEETGP